MTGEALSGDPLWTWLETESERNIAFQRRAKRSILLIVVAVALSGAANAASLFILAHQVGVNRRVLASVCSAQRHGLDERRESLATSVPLFRHLIPRDKLDAAIVRTRFHIAELEHDRAKLHCREVGVHSIRQTP